VKDPFSPRLRVSARVILRHPTAWIRLSRISSRSCFRPGGPKDDSPPGRQPWVPVSLWIQPRTGRQNPLLPDSFVERPLVFPTTGRTVVEHRDAEKTDRFRSRPHSFFASSRLRVRFLPIHGLPHAKPRRPRRAADFGSTPTPASRSIPHGAAQGTGAFFTPSRRERRRWG
jgi:hypothetical protein